MVNLSKPVSLVKRFAPAVSASASDFAAAMDRAHAARERVRALSLEAHLAAMAAR